MEKKIVKIEGEPPGQIASKAVEANGFIFTSGILPWDTVTNELISDDITAATVFALKQLEKVLEAAGSGMDKIVKINIFLKDMEDWMSFNEAYQKFFPENPPARCTIGAGAIALDLPLEIEAIAIK